jgi:2-amino-4-hydroxy-6-hydroxymethyldihydropteridine diphosphokinase
MAAETDFSDYAFISIGANLPSTAGDPAETIKFAYDSLAKLSMAPVLQSSLYLSTPVDSPPGTPDFLNAMAALVPATGETPVSLLDKLQAIEAEAGRKRNGIRNEARSLDLDLVLFRQEKLADARLQVPHPRALARKFVMQPLVEIVGRAFIFPGQHQTAGEILDNIRDQEINRLG